MWCILLQMLNRVVASPIDKLITNAAEDSEYFIGTLYHIWLMLLLLLLLMLLLLLVVVAVIVVVVVEEGKGGGGIQIYRTFCIAFLAVCFSHLFWHRGGS